MFRTAEAVLRPSGNGHTIDWPAAKNAHPENRTIATLIVRGYPISARPKTADKFSRSSEERQSTAVAPRPSTAKYLRARCVNLASVIWLTSWQRFRTLVVTKILRASRTSPRRNVYLVDTDVVSELRKKAKADRRVVQFFKDAAASNVPLYLAAVTVGELRRGVELIRHRGDLRQANLLDRWLDTVLTDYSENVLPFDADAAQVWGRLRVPHPENPLDKQIAATALLYDLIVVTRNTRHFASTGAKLFNPFAVT